MKVEFVQKFDSEKVATLIALHNRWQFHKSPLVKNFATAGCKAIFDAVSSRKFESNAPRIILDCGAFETFGGVNHKVGRIVTVSQGNYPGPLFMIGIQEIQAKQRLVKN